VTGGGTGLYKGRRDQALGPWRHRGHHEPQARHRGPAAKVTQKLTDHEVIALQVDVRDTEQVSAKLDERAGIPIVMVNNVTRMSMVCCVLMYAEECLTVWGATSSRC
jgi:hypothetical protein